MPAWTDTLADLVEPGVAAAAAAVFGLQLARYALIAGGAFLAAHVWRPPALERRRIARAPVARAQALREVGLSLSSMLVFAAVGALVARLRLAGLVHVCPDTGCHGLAWTVAAVPLMLVIHDTWFYWTHRALHARALFRWFHKAHHLSHDPSPLTSFAFHPVEAVVNATFVPLVLLALPIPRPSMLAFQTLAFAINVYGHLGVELLPPGFQRGLAFRLLNTTTHHHQHHRTTRWNFGLYFNVWDRLCGTNHRAYAETFLENARRAHPPG